MLNSSVVVMVTRTGYEVCRRNRDRGPRFLLGHGLLVFSYRIRNIFMQGQARRLFFLDMLDYWHSSSPLSLW